MKLNQGQCEALADILVLAMCIDGHFSLGEEEEIRKIIADIGWNENLSPALHINSSIARARDIIGEPDKVEAYLEKLMPVIGDKESARYIFEASQKVLNSDGGNEDEGVFTSQLKAALNV